MNLNSIQNKSKLHKSIGSHKSQGKYIGYLFVLPAVALLSMFLLFPAVISFIFSTTDFNILRPQDIKFIALDNYFQLFRDNDFYIALRNNIYFTVIIVPFQGCLAFALALLVRKNLKFISIFRVAYFSPLITSMTVIAILWTFIYNPNPTQGLLNSFLVSIGIPPSAFLRSSETAMNSIIFMTGWQGAGYQMMIFLAGLQAIPDEHYEAASIDGANALQKFWNVTIPGLINVLVFIVMVMTINAMKLFTQPYVMTQGGPQNSTRTLAYYIYQQGFQFRNAGYASSISVIFFLIVVSLSLFLKKVIRVK